MTAEPIDVAAVKAKHSRTPVYEYDDVNGVFVYGPDDELVLVRQLCTACSLDDTIEALGDCEWSEDLDGSVDWPCDAHRLAVEAERIADALRVEQGLREEVRVAFAGVTDRMDQFAYDELAHLIEDRAYQPEQVQQCGFVSPSSEDGYCTCVKAQHSPEEPHACKHGLLW